MKYLEAIVGRAKKRTCTACWATWYVNVDQERLTKVRGAVGELTAITTGSALTRVAGIAAANTAYSVLQTKCPKCAAEAYTEKIILFDKGQLVVEPELVSTCPACKAVIPADATRCGHCTSEIPAETVEKSKDFYAKEMEKFEKKQSLLSARFVVQDRIRKQGNVVGALSILLTIGLSAFAVYFVTEYTWTGPLWLLDIILVGPMVAVIVFMIAFSIVNRKKLIRFAEKQEA